MSGFSGFEDELATILREDAAVVTRTELANRIRDERRDTLIQLEEEMAPNQLALIQGSRGGLLMRIDAHDDGSAALGGWFYRGWFGGFASLLS